MHILISYIGKVCRKMATTVTEAEQILTFLGDFRRILTANFATVSTTVSTALPLGH